ncbi:MAG TPA: DUF1800 domain-containing protein [Candidatus Limnocylindrales bacterium]|nr:DUF1800 domain-containing protein [Candidatus Limnocylindrales bacterium]
MRASSASRKTQFLRAPKRGRGGPWGAHRIDAAGAAFLAVTLTATLAIILGFGAPAATANNGATKAPPKTALDKKFKGSLPITELTEDEAILHALNRLAYGPRPGDVERIRQMGLAKWLDRQLDPKSIDDSALDQRLSRYPTLTMSSKKLLDDFPPPGQAAKKEGMTKEEYQQQMAEKRQDSVAQMLPTGNENFDKANVQLARMQGPGRITAELAMAKLDRAIYSERQLEAVMEDFWFNHFNVFAGKGADRWLLAAYVRDTIRPHTMGKFQDLLIATAKSPAMLFYLDNWLSADPVAFQRMQREMMMRRRRYYGVFGEMPPGPPPGFPMQRPNQPQKKQDRGLNENYGREVMELHTVGVDAGYTQQDVIEMARCLTGWTVHEPRKDPEFFFDERIHAQGKKIVMGRTFNYGGMKDGEEALKMLANDPHTAQFISTQLARHFVSDNPPQALVDRMATEFESSGGDIRSVLHTMIYSPEFWSKEAYRAKVKTPFELVASTARALNGDVEVTLPLVQWVGRMGEPLYQCQPPTGYSDKAETWVNSGALLNRLNFALAFASDHMGGAEVDLKAMFGDAAATDPNAALSRSLDIFLDDQVADSTKKTLEARLSDPQVLQARLDDPVKQVNEGLIAGLVLGTPEFQRR